MIARRQVPQRFHVFPESPVDILHAQLGAVFPGEKPAPPVSELSTETVDNRWITTRLAAGSSPLHGFS